MGEALHVWVGVGGRYGKFMYFPLTCAMNLKLLLKKKEVIKKKSERSREIERVIS